MLELGQVVLHFAMVANDTRAVPYLVSLNLAPPNSLDQVRLHHIRYSLLPQFPFYAFKSCAFLSHTKFVQAPRFLSDVKPPSLPGEGSGLVISFVWFCNKSLIFFMSVCISNCIFHSISRFFSDSKRQVKVCSQLRKMMIFKFFFILEKQKKSGFSNLSVHFSFFFFNFSNHNYK